MKHEDYVSFEQAKDLKALGFYWQVIKGYSHFPGEKVKTFNAQEENVNAIYSKWCFAAPTLAQAQKWLREVKQIIIIPCVMYVKDILKYDFYIDGESLVVEYDFEGFDTYEQALSAGIDKALELLKEENDGK